MNIANYFTLLRLIISPIFLFIYLKHDWLNISPQALPYLLLSLLFVCEASDFCDGYLARRLNQVTELGKILDPMADSIARISVFLAFTQAPVSIPIWLVFIFMYRDSVVSTLRTACALRGFTLAARSSGKLKAVVQALAAVIILILLIPTSQGYLNEDTFHLLANSIVLVAALYTLYSGMDYLIAHRKYIVYLLKPTKKTSSNIS